MGLVINELKQLLDRHLSDRGLVLWFDPERHYLRAVSQLQIAGCQILQFDGSYYDLRAKAEPFIRGSEPPRLLL